MTKKHKAHFENLQEMENKLNRLITEYSTIHKGLMDETKTYLESSQGNNRYAGKNIKLSNGSKFYVTDNGYYKSYSNDVIYDMTGEKWMSNKN